MHRPTLVLRRFGALSFGLGYFDGGRWVDHLDLDDRGASLALDHGLAAIHAQLACCTPAAIAIERDGPTSVHRDRVAAVRRPLDDHVPAVARQSSAR